VVTASRKYNNAGRFIGWTYTDDGVTPVSVNFANIAQETDGNLESLVVQMTQLVETIERIFRELTIHSDLLVEGMDVLAIDVEDERDRPQEAQAISGTT
jgi:hypothetical protein